MVVADLKSFKRVIPAVFALIVALGTLHVVESPSSQATTPAAPTNLVVKVAGDVAVATWSAVAGATTYEVKAYAALDESTSVATCTSSSTTCTFTPFSSAAKSFYEVRVSAPTVGAISTRIGLCNGGSDLCARPFNEVVFAGTHNSMAADRAWGLGAVAVTTQKYTIAEQLQQGIRALSFDVWYGKDVFVDVWNADGPSGSGVEPFLCHSYCTLGATTLEEGFENVVDFLEANPREVVVVYFEDYVSVADTQAIVDSSGLDNYVFNWSGTALPYTTSLGDLITSGKRVVLVSQNVSTANQRQWYPRLTNIGMDTDYDFNATNKLTDPGLLPVSCDPTPWGRRGNGRFFVMQHFITNVIASVSSSAVVNASDVLVQRALACKERRGVMPSVLLVDYFEEPEGQPGVLNATRALNDLYSSTEPRIASASPATGTAGTTITLTGVNLTGTTSVTFGSTAAASFSVVNSNSLTAVAPAGTGAVNISVTTPAGSTMLWRGFTYDGVTPSDTDPVVSSTSPSSGSTAGDQVVTISGSNFTGATAVMFGGSPATNVTVVSDSSITARTPRGLAGQVAVTVLTTGGRGVLPDSFSYVEPVTPAPVTPPTNSDLATTLGSSSVVTSTDSTDTTSQSPSTTITAQSIINMSVTEILKLRPAQVAQFRPEIIRAMSPEQVASLQPAALRKLPTDAINAMTSSQARRLTSAQVNALLPRQLGALNKSALRSIKPRALKDLSFKTLSALPPRVVANMRPQQIKSLDPRFLRTLD